MSTEARFSEHMARNAAGAALGNYAAWVGLASNKVEAILTNNDVAKTPEASAPAWLVASNRIALGDTAIAAMFRAQRDSLHVAALQYVLEVAEPSLIAGSPSFVDLALVLDSAHPAFTNSGVLASARQATKLIGKYADGLPGHNPMLEAEARVYALLPPNAPASVRELYRSRLVRAAHSAGYRPRGLRRNTHTGASPWATNIIAEAMGSRPRR